MARIGLPALLMAMVEQDASDLHITVGTVPQLRIHGKMVKVKGDPFNPQDTKEICFSVLTDSQKSEFEKNSEIDFAFGIKDVARFRGNLFYQRGGVAGVFRKIPLAIPEFETLNLPTVIRKIIRRPNGLIIVAGPTGSGKTTTIAALLDILNREESGHLLTIEDPIEYVHLHKNCVVNQREVGVDTKNFSSALKRILRQDPDFVLIGELRDMETIEMALTMAETGHLVFATLHTNNAIQSINRLIGAFPPYQQDQIRQTLSFTLQAVIAQQLIPMSAGSGRCVACEILVPNAGIRNLIRSDKVHQIYSSMQTGQDESGMQTMNQSLASLVRSGMITKAAAIECTSDPEELGKYLEGVSERGHRGERSR